MAKYMTRTVNAATHTVKHDKVGAMEYTMDSGNQAAKLFAREYGVPVSECSVHTSFDSKTYRMPVEKFLELAEVVGEEEEK